MDGAEQSGRAAEVPSAEPAKAAQLTIPLVAPEPHALQLFVAHSGVAQPLALVRQALSELQHEPDRFRSIYLFGPEGSGKSHLVDGAMLEAFGEGVARDKIAYFDLSDEALRSQLDRDPERLIADYERLRAGGGVFLVASRYSPEQCTGNPHLLSRFRAGAVEQLQLAREEELRTVLEALFERRNLRVSSRTLDFIIHRLPTDPLSFHRIVAKIDGFLWAKGGTPSVHTIKRALLSDLSHR